MLDAKFAEEDAAAFDMEMVINSTKTSAKVYDNLAHYLFNKMITAQDNAGDFDFFSPWTWFTILEWIVAVAALVLVIILRLKVRPLFFLLMARGSQAAALKLALPKYTLEPPQVTAPPLDILAEWIQHVSHVPNLLPAEILILLGIIFAILFKIACMIYRAQKKETARTRLVMEIGNGTDAITFPVMELPYLAKHYRIKLSRSRMVFQLIDTKFGANLSWTNGVQLTNAVLEMSVPLPPKIFVPFWKVAKLRSLLQVPHFAAIRILSDNTNRYLDVLVLRKPQQDLSATPTTAGTIYPVLPSASAPPLDRY